MPDEPPEDDESLTSAHTTDGHVYHRAAPDGESAAPLPPEQPNPDAVRELKRLSKSFRRPGRLPQGEPWNVPGMLRRAMETLPKEPLPRHLDDLALFGDDEATDGPE